MTLERSPDQRRDAGAEDEQREPLTFTVLDEFFKARIKRRLPRDDRICFVQRASDQRCLSGKDIAQTHRFAVELLFQYQPRAAPSCALHEQIERVGTGDRTVVVYEDGDLRVAVFLFHSLFLRRVVPAEAFLRVDVAPFFLRARLGFSACVDGSAGAKATTSEASSSPAIVAAREGARRRRAGLVTFAGSSGMLSEGGGGSTAGGVERRFHGAIDRIGSRGAVRPVTSASPSERTRKMWRSGIAPTSA